MKDIYQVVVKSWYKIKYWKPRKVTHFFAESLSVILWFLITCNFDNSAAEIHQQVQ